MIDGGSTDGFSIRPFGRMQYIDSYPFNTTEHAGSSDSCPVPQTNSINMFSSAYPRSSPVISQPDMTYRYTSSVILNSAYDYDPQSHEDELIKMATKVQEVGLSVVRPEITIIVATFPMRK